MQHLDSRSLYAAFKAKDVRFDGRFFVGVSSTGIYCRPVCRAKLPKEENCTFYASAAAAEQAGYRPCLVCRPERAPGAAPIDASSALALKGARLIEEQCTSEQGLEAYARRLGCSSRHFRRVFSAEFTVSPVQYLQTCRLLLAKNLLADTDLSVTKIAMAAGFGSLRRFNDVFKKHYRLSPAALRKQTATTQRNEAHITLVVGYRPPYQWSRMLRFLAQRAIPGVETVIDDSYLRTVHCLHEGKKLYGWLRVEHHADKNALAVTVSLPLLPKLPYVLARVRDVFDLYCYPDAVYETLCGMNAISPGLCEPGTRVPGCFEPFEMSVRAVLGQQITVKGASTLAGRIAKTYGTPLDTGIPGLTCTFPGAHDILALEDEIANHLGPLGVTSARSKTILSLAHIMANGEIDFSYCLQPEEVIKKLLAVPGIGSWTAHYIALRAMGWPDAFPHNDYGIKKALVGLTWKEIYNMAEAWRPWRGYAAINLWNSL